MKTWQYSNVYSFCLSNAFISTIDSRRKRAAVLIVAIAFSLIIETLQLYYMRGLFQLDDQVSNTSGIEEYVD